jgi:hypothetical protein
MNTLEFKQTLELNNDYEVIVVGGGPSGCTAAAAAAREGAKTLLIEATGALGGMGTSGLVPAWCPFTDYEQLIYRGMAEKVLKAGIAGMPHVANDHYNWTPIDPELLKRIYDDLVTENGAEVLFNSMLSAVNADEHGTVESIVIANKAGLTAYKADVYIDCSGDADLAIWAGAEYEQGDEEGDLQPATHCFMLANVDDYAYIYGESLHRANPKSPIHAICAEGKYPLIPDTHSCNSQIIPGVVGFNAGHIWDVDNTKPKTVSNALIQGRKIAYAFEQALAEYHPKAYANAKLVATGSLMGIRETRRVIGDYYLTAEELMEFKSFEDEICRNAYYIDVHHKKKQIGGKKEGGDGFRFPQGKSHGLPYRCLTPKGIKNVLIAGRSISTDRPTQGSTRVMPVCLAMGEAVGIAAKMAARENNGDVHAVDTDALRDKLKEHGAYLP